jgi:hypothetical protein
MLRLHEGVQIRDWDFRSAISRSPFLLSPLGTVVIVCAVEEANVGEMLNCRCCCSRCCWC